MQPSTFYLEYMNLRNLRWGARDWLRKAGDHARHGQQRACAVAWSHHIATRQRLAASRARLVELILAASGQLPATTVNERQPW